MTYLRYQQLKPEDFKRLCGVDLQTFGRMVNVLEAQVEQQKKKPGRPSKLSVEDQVLINQLSGISARAKVLVIHSPMVSA